MVIMVSTLAKAINEVRHITPEEITRDTIKVIGFSAPDTEDNNTDNNNTDNNGKGVLNNEED